MASARTVLAQALDAGLPESYTDAAGRTLAYRLTGYQRALDRVDARTVLVWQDQLTPQGIGSDRAMVTLTVWVLTPHQDGPDVDDDLDAALLDVLAVLHGRRDLVWTVAERGVLADTWHGYKITVRAGGHIIRTPEE